eukprot:scaffold17461_cov53-Attheya_sp.AAC.5
MAVVERNERERHVDIRCLVHSAVTDPESIIVPLPGTGRLQYWYQYINKMSYAYFLCKLPLAYLGSNFVVIA